MSSLAFPRDRENTIENQLVPGLEPRFRLAFALHHMRPRIPARIASRVAHGNRSPPGGERIGAGTMHRERVMADDIARVTIPGDEPVLRITFEPGEIRA